MTSWSRWLCKYVQLLGCLHPEHWFPTSTLLSEDDVGPFHLSHEEDEPMRWCHAVLCPQQPTSVDKSNKHHLPPPFIYGRRLGTSEFTSKHISLLLLWLVVMEIFFNGYYGQLLLVRQIICVPTNKNK